MKLRRDGRVGDTKIRYRGKEGIFMQTIKDNFTAYDTPMIPLMNGLRKVIFPKGEWVLETGRYVAL